MKNKSLQICLFLTIFGLLLIASIGRVSASTEGNLQITNLAGTTVSYTYDQLLAMPMTNVSASLYCYGNLVTGGDWGGVSLGYMLQQVGLDSASASIDFLAIDGYKVSIPLSLAMQSQVIIAYEKDGLPLSEGLRLVLPGENGNMWIRSINAIAMSTVEVSIQQVNTVPPALLGILSSVNLTGLSSTQHQEPSQPQPTATPKNEASPKSVEPPANVTQPAPKTSMPQSSSPEDLSLSFPFVVVCGIALGTTVALVSAVYVTHGRSETGNRR